MTDVEMARLRWRCRRGMRELDTLLLRYVDDIYPASGPDEQAAFRRLLTTPDPEILALLTGRATTDDPRLARIIADLGGLPAGG